jgi:ferredoxin
MPQAELMPIVRLLRQDTVKPSADTVGLVFPNFCMTVPIPLRDFLQRLDLASTRRYIFALCTRGGSPSEAFEYINEILEKQNKRLNAQLDVNMPWNHMLTENLTATTNSEKMIGQLESVMQDELDLFTKAINAREAYVQPDTDAGFKIPFGIKVFDLLVPKWLNYKLHDYMYQRLVRFYSDSKCTGCGVCEKVCLNKRITLVDQRPVWKQDVRCYACFACINFCPQQAIQIESRFPIQSNTDVNDRYHHPSMTYKDIAEQR